jgi:hypothetical protein
LESYSDFSKSKFADRLYEQHFFMAFVNGWKRGFFSLGQVVNYEIILTKELEEISRTVCDDALKTTYNPEISYQFLLLTIEVSKLGFESGRMTNVNHHVGLSN